MTVWQVIAYDDADRDFWIVGIYGTEDAANNEAKRARAEYMRDYYGEEDTGQDIDVRWVVSSHPVIVEEES